MKHIKAGYWHKGVWEAIMAISNRKIWKVFLEDGMWEQVYYFNRGPDNRTVKGHDRQKSKF